MTRRPDPIAIQQRLAELLARARADARVHGELMRARREFFGDDEPAYARDDDEREAAAVRFAEWFLLERASDVMGEVPFEALTRGGAATDEDDALAASRAGLFLAETSGREPTIRDLEGGERLALTELPLDLHAGDLLIGRVFPLPDGRSVPSAVLTILPGATQLAVAFQKDVRALGLERRLTQAELERLVFRQRAMAAAEPAPDEVPLERLEAELQSRLDAHGKGGGERAARISAALKVAPGPGIVLGPLLDEMAFDTDIDLERLRELGVRIWNAQHAGAVPHEDRSTPDAAAPRRFAARPGETLGEQLARRIEEGLAENEDVEAMFADVERMLGDPIGDEDDDEDHEPEVDPEVGDLSPLLREFVWETGLSDADSAVLEKFVEQQRAAPVPRLSVEYLEADDYVRFLLRTWLDAPPTRRTTALRGAFSLLERFLDWLAETQLVDLRDRLAAGRDQLVDRSERLQAASLALSTSHAPGDGDPASFTLMRVTGHAGDRMEILAGESRREVEVALPGDAGRELEEGDLVFGALRETAPSGPVRLVGMVVVVPAEVEHLLG